MKNIESACSCPKHKGPMECTVGKCTNNEDQGNGLYLHVVDKYHGNLGVEWVCIPCWDAITDQTTDPQFSQVFRNMKAHFFKPALDVENYYEDDYEKEQSQPICDCTIPINVHGLCLECSKNIKKKENCDE